MAAVMCYHWQNDHDGWEDQRTKMILADFGPLDEGRLAAIGKLWET